MNGAMKPYGLPAVTERSAGVSMERKQRLTQAAEGFMGSEKARAAGRQIARNRNERQAISSKAKESTMQKARQQALLEILYATQVLGVPMDAVQQAVDMGTPWTPEPMGMPQDNLSAMQPSGLPLQGSMGM